MAILAPLYEHEPKRVAAIAGNTTITYGRLCEDIDSMTHWLFAQGIEPGDRVTLHIRDIGNPDYWDWILHLGAIRAGLTQSSGGIPPAIARTGACGPYKAAVGDLGNLAKQANPQLKLAFGPKGTEPLAEQLEIEISQRKLDKLEDQSVRLLSTSGTTGKPKVLAWDAKLLADRLKQVREIGGFDADTKLLTLLGLITTTGLRYPIAGWQLGATVLLPAIGPDRCAPAELVGRSTFLATSPFRMRAILRQVEGEWPGKKQRVVELFGGRVPPFLHDEVLERCCDKLLMSYGATEVGRVACGETSLVERDPGAVGMIEPGITVEIVDRSFKPVEPGKVGIVRMKSDFMCDGYIGQSGNQGPRASLRDGWFYPGDFGILYEDGLFAITGRLSETLNIAGAKLSPTVLEDRISKFPEVEDVVAMAIQLDSGDVLTIGVVCDEKTDLKALRVKVAATMPKGFPFTLIRLTGIPRNAMGRIPRRQVTRIVTEQAKRMQAQRAKAAKAN